MGGDEVRDRDCRRARGITCVLQTHFSNLFLGVVGWCDGAG